MRTPILSYPKLIYPHLKSTIIKPVIIPEEFLEYAKSISFFSSLSERNFGIPQKQIFEASKKLQTLSQNNSRLSNFISEASHNFQFNPANITVFESTEPVINPSISSEIRNPKTALTFSSLICGLNLLKSRPKIMSIVQDHIHDNKASFSFVGGQNTIAFHQDSYLKFETGANSYKNKMEILPFIALFNSNSNSDSETHIISNDDILKNFSHKFPESFNILSNIRFTLINDQQNSIEENFRVIATLPNKTTKLKIFNRSFKFIPNEDDLKKNNYPIEKINQAFEHLFLLIEECPTNVVVLNNNQHQLVIFSNENSVHARINPDDLKPNKSVTMQRIVGAMGIEMQKTI